MNVKPSIVAVGGISRAVAIIVVSRSCNVFNDITAHGLEENLIPMMGSHARHRLLEHFDVHEAIVVPTE